MMMETEGETIFTDYREVDGIVVAYNLVIFEGGEEGGTLTVTDVKFNSGLEDSFFKIEQEGFLDKGMVGDTGFEPVTSTV